MVISLDGTPFSLIQKRAKIPDSPWQDLIANGALKRMRSSRPEMSSVAWASYLTGTNPGEHGVFGFVEPQFSPRPRLIYPRGTNLQAPTILNRVHDAGGTSVSINVPMTEPPPQIKGIVIGGFLGVDLAGNVHPASLEEELRRDGYVVDVEPGLAYESRDRYLDALNAALTARVRAAHRLATEMPWDYFHLHIMETDRLYHFFWDEPGYGDAFNAFLTRCEEVVTDFAELARQRGAELVLLSDHGFTRCRRIVFINALLEKVGLLKYTSVQPSFETIHEDSASFALAPGRIFINSRSDHERKPLQDQIAGLLRDVRDPETGEHPFARVDTREDLYSGPHVNQAADLILLPASGYDIKADFGAERVFETPTTLVGTHTYNDAFYLATSGNSHQWKDGEKDIADAGQDVLNLMGIA